MVLNNGQVLVRGKEYIYGDHAAHDFRGPSKGRSRTGCSLDEGESCCGNARALAAGLGGEKQKKRKRTGQDGKRACKAFL